MVINLALEGQGRLPWRKWLSLDLVPRRKPGKEDTGRVEDKTGKTVLGRRNSMSRDGGGNR